MPGHQVTDSWDHSHLSLVTQQTNLTTRDNKHPDLSQPITGPVTTVYQYKMSEDWLGQTLHTSMVPLLPFNMSHGQIHDRQTSNLYTFYWSKLHYGKTIYRLFCSNLRSKIMVNLYVIKKKIETKRWNIEWNCTGTTLEQQYFVLITYA